MSNIFIYKDLYSQGSLPALDQKKIISMLMWMTVAFSILVSPKNIFALSFTSLKLKKVDINAEDGHALAIANGFLKLLQLSNSICNIFIYAKLHNKCRLVIKEITKRCRCSRLKRRNTFLSSRCTNTTRLHYLTTPLETPIDGCFEDQMLEQQ